MDTGTPLRFGPYLVRRELGRGAMGVVYEAFDALLGRLVALKVLRIEPPDACVAESLRLRFRREVRAAQLLAHPNIVAVYGCGEEAGVGLRPYLAMELVRGRTLHSALESGRRFTLAEARRIMRQLLEALEHAHAQGVVHRDIKPANLMLRHDGHLKVMDFGVAKFDTGEAAQWHSPVGTLSHMSPEQLAGQPVDGRSDLFSCGAVLYQLITGEPPFRGPTASVIQKVLYQDPVPPSLALPGLPSVLDPVVQRALAKQPAERYRSTQTFAMALDVAFDEAQEAEAVSGQQPPAQRSHDRWRRPVVVGLGLLAAAGVGQALWRLRQPVMPTQAALSAPSAEPQFECAEEALRGDPRCQVALGNLYRSGVGVPRDPQKALQWYRRAAEQGHDAAQYELGEARAQNHLGRAYELGRGVHSDVGQAAQWYGKAAAQGYPPGQANLGRLYLRGRGVKRNLARAAELLQQSAARGDPEALFHLGWMYEKGVGKPRDLREAALLYRQALADHTLQAGRREAATAFLDSYQSP
jgi:TPR repeat protein